MEVPEAWTGASGHVLREPWVPPQLRDGFAELIAELDAAEPEGLPSRRTGFREQGQTGKGSREFMALSRPERQAQAFQGLPGKGPWDRPSRRPSSRSQVGRELTLRAAAGTHRAETATPDQTGLFNTRRDHTRATCRHGPICASRDRRSTFTSTVKSRSDDLEVRPAGAYIRPLSWEFEWS